MDLDALIARRDKLMSELRIVREELKLTNEEIKLTNAHIRRSKGLPEKIQSLAKKRRTETLALRRKGMTYKQIAEAIGTHPQYARTMAVKAEREERWAKEKEKL